MLLRRGQSFLQQSGIQQSHNQQEMERDNQVNMRHVEDITWCVCISASHTLWSDMSSFRTLSDTTFIVGSHVFGVWTNGINSRALCDQPGCNTTVSRIHDLKRHYERMHPRPAIPSTGPGRTGRSIHRRESSGLPSLRTSSATRFPSVSTTPVVSSPLSQEISLPEASVAPDDPFTAGVDSALDQLKLTSPTKESFASTANPGSSHALKPSI